MVKICFNEENEKQRQAVLTRSLTDFRTKYPTTKGVHKNKKTFTEFAEKLTGFTSKEREEHKPIDDRGDKEVYFFKENRRIFIRNLFMLNEFFGSKRETAKEIIMNSISKEVLQNKFDHRRNELKTLAETYTKFAEDADAIAENLFNNPDFEKDDVFKVADVNRCGDSTEAVSYDNHEHPFREVNFFGLSEMDELRELEDCDTLSESQLMARKAILYTDLGNKDLALQCADDALKSDPENGVAWMFKGFLALQLDVEFNRYPKSLSEINSHVDHNDIVKFFVNAWRFLPSTLKETMSYKGYTSAPVYPYHSFYNEKCLIRTFILNAKQLNACVFPDELSTEKKIFLNFLKRDFGEISFIDQTLTPYYFMKLLPLVHEVSSEVAKQLAQRWVDSILSVKPDSNLLNKINYKLAIEKLGQDRNFLTELRSNATLSFDEVEALSLHITSLLTELEHQCHSELLNRLKKLRKE